jgi:hypothetical protein
MKQKRAKWIFIFLFAIGLTGIQGQTTLNVKEKSGAQTSFLLNGLSKIIFTPGYISVNKKDGDRSDFALANIRYLNFNIFTSIDPLKSDGVSEMLIYPNPVLDRLQVRYESLADEVVQIQVIDTQGRITYQQSLKSQTGTNYTSIPVVSFQKGLYLCRLLHGNKIENNKFIKY